MRNGTARRVRFSTTVFLLSALPALSSARLEGQSAGGCNMYLQGMDFISPATDIARLIDIQDTTSRASFTVQRGGRGFAGNVCNAPDDLARLARALATPAPDDGLAILAPELLLVGNSAYPRPLNDGALWAGRGLNAAVMAGARFQWSIFSAALAPVVTWQSNSAFDFQPAADTLRSEYAYRWRTGIDAPQRFGSGAFSRLDAGQSFARIDIRGFGAGVSSENIQWGPARRNPILLSGAAGGFPHAFIETSRPVDIWIGDLEGQAFWGRLEESEYYDRDPDNDYRMLAGLLLAFQPRLLDGLTVGAGRLQTLIWWPELSGFDLAREAYTGVGQNPKGRGGDNQMLGFFFRWKSAPAGFEVYGEWARDDHWGTWTELLRNLDSSQAWGLGLQKVVRHGDNALRLSAEVTHLADALPVQHAGRSGPIAFYTNTSVRQGHTHRGQILGAPVGTGGEALFIGGDYFWRAGRTSLSLERARYNEDAYMREIAPTFGAAARDTEVSIRAGHLATRGPFSVDAGIGWSLRYNRDFLGLDTIVAGEPYRRDHNWGLRMRLRWTPPGTF